MYAHLPEQLIAPNDSSPFIARVARTGKIAGYAILISFAAGLAYEPIKPIANTSLGLSLMAFVICICILGLRHISKTSNQSLTGVILKLFLIFGMLPLALTLLFIAIAYFAHAPAINPQ